MDVSLYVFAVNAVKRLVLCEDVDRTACGGILFVGSLAPPLHMSTLDGPPSAVLPPYKLSSESAAMVVCLCTQVCVLVVSHMTITR